MLRLPNLLLLSVFLWVCKASPQDASSASSDDIDDVDSGPITSPEEARFDVFMTEPNFRSARINVQHITDDRSKLASGYYFFAPFGGGAYGPQIFDEDGQLVWWGRDQNRGRVKNFQVCDHLGSIGTHLCWSEMDFTMLNYELSSNRIFDNTYNQVGRDYGAVGDMRSPNPHEYNMLPGGETFLQAIYQLKPMDLTEFGGLKEGFVEDGCFQEIDVRTGQPVFRWCGLEHMPITETLLYLNTPGNKQNYSEGIGGAGSIRSAWDWMHFNAVDKNEEGDYLVSARHLDQLIKIAGKNNVHGVKPGTVLWQLGGKSNNFEMEDDFEFSRQHHVRFLSTSATETVLSVFNNGWEIRNQDGFANHSSSGQVIRINNETMKATLLHDYVHPDSDLGWEGSLTIAQGSMDVLPNGNAIVGWGTIPEISEYAEDGELVFHASFTNHTGRNYRVFKMPWTGNPQWSPKLLAYSLNCSSADSPLKAHVSWNGATEVKAWRFHISMHSASGPWIPAGTFAKMGFETTVDLTPALSHVFASFAAHVSVEALDANGDVLATTTAETFVPRKDAAERHSCGPDGCTSPVFFSYNPEMSCVGTCGRSLVPVVVVILLVLAGLESLVFFASMYWRWTWRVVEEGERGYRGLGEGYDDEDFSEPGSPLTEKIPRPVFDKRSRSGVEPVWKKGMERLLRASGTEV